MIQLAHVSQKWEALEDKHEELRTDLDSARKNEAELEEKLRRFSADNDQLRFYLKEKEEIIRKGEEKIRSLQNKVTSGISLRLFIWSIDFSVLSMLSCSNSLSIAASRSDAETTLTPKSNRDITIVFFSSKMQFKK